MNLQAIRDHVASEFKQGNMWPYSAVAAAQVLLAEVDALTAMLCVNLGCTASELQTMRESSEESKPCT